MGNSASSHRERTENHIDFGGIRPFGTYTGPQDWNHEIVAQLIKDRKLAPFYWPLEDYDDDFTDEQIMAARKAPPTEASSPTSDAASEALSATLSRSSYYPPNINKTRCCDHYICTECFVQIKRADPTPQHLVSEPAACPYCVQDNFGVIYTPPPWRAGIGSEGFPAPDLYKITSAQSIAPPPPLAKQRRQSLSHTASGVITTDHIRPDWEAKLAAVRAAVARRANRRIIMRQVGDRLIPVGITSGRVQLNPEGSEGTGPIVETEDGSSRGSRRRRHELSQLLGSMGMAGQDLEELMVMEAMRLSLLEHEQAQRRQQDEEARQRANGGGGSSSTAPAPPVPGAAISATSAPVSGSRTPIIIPAGRGAHAAEPVITSAPSHAHRVSGSSLLAGTPPHRNGTPLRPSEATPPSESSVPAGSATPRRASRPSSLVVDPSSGLSPHQAAAAAATTFLSAPVMEETASSSTPVPVPAPTAAPIIQAPVPVPADFLPAPTILGPDIAVPRPVRTPMGRTETMATEMSEDGGMDYEPLASPDTEENEYLLDGALDEAMHENMELPQRSAQAALER
ncbi:hypothetical protein CALCODRAFT_485423 [Calocera cornea HHB12733]|uniref:RING-type domain-containing protein n=1 Tax=Calocera cornea HHB12733 TaxID=1353952 RepID=A0A165ECR4_9BASI|nr:hypothetical protein CALCODRAFT_485423 [Calocera cornea HHB12733]